MRVGAIDIGSNSVRLLVADVPDGEPGSGTLVTVARSGEACRLARGLDRNGTIDPEMADKAGLLVSDFVRRANRLGAVRVVIGGTAALRIATNGSQVTDLISTRAGLPVRILSGDEEARLVYRSVVLGLGERVRRSSCVVFDIGGGSTEVVSGVGGEAGRWVSLPFGAVSLTERHLASDPPRPEELESIRSEVRDGLMHACAYMPERTPLLAGVGGTVTVLGSLDQGLQAFEPALLEGWTILPDRLAALVERLAASSHEERLSWRMLGEGRADIVVAGAVVVAELARRFPAPGLVCSTQGLRYGLARLAAEAGTQS